ncbi:MAG: hypothetical protein R3B45_07345 [Bdellovibrionota bacterium]
MASRRQYHLLFLAFFLVFSCKSVSPSSGSSTSESMNYQVDKTASLNINPQKLPVVDSDNFLVDLTAINPNDNYYFGFKAAHEGEIVLSLQIPIADLILDDKKQPILPQILVGNIANGNIENTKIVRFTTDANGASGQISITTKGNDEFAVLLAASKKLSKSYTVVTNASFRKVITLENNKRNIGINYWPSKDQQGNNAYKALTLVRPSSTPKPDKMDLILQVKLSPSDIDTRQPLFSLIKIKPENDKDSCDFVLKEAWFVYTQDKTERKFAIPLDPDAHYFPPCSLNEADLSFIPVGGIEHYNIILKLEKKTMDIPNFIVESTLMHPPVDYYNKPMPEEKVIKINPKPRTYRY